MARFIKVPAKVIPAEGSPAAVDREFERDYPALVEYLTCVAGEGGVPRVTATFLVFAEDNVWKMCLSDRDTSQTLWASADSVEELFEAIEAMLVSDRPQWRTATGKRKVR